MSAIAVPFTRRANPPALLPRLGSKGTPGFQGAEEVSIQLWILNTEAQKEREAGIAAGQADQVCPSYLFIEHLLCAHGIF